MLLWHCRSLDNHNIHAEQRKRHCFSYYCNYSQVQRQRRPLDAVVELSLQVNPFHPSQCVQNTSRDAQTQGHSVCILLTLVHNKLQHAAARDITLGVVVVVVVVVEMMIVVRKVR